MPISLFLLIFKFFYQICDADKDAEKISPDDEDAEKPDENKTSDTGRNDNKDVEKSGQKQGEVSTKVKMQHERDVCVRS